MSEHSKPRECTIRIFRLLPLNEQELSVATEGQLKSQHNDLNFEYVPMIEKSAFDALSARCAELEKDLAFVNSQWNAGSEIWERRYTEANQEIESLRAQLSEKERELAEVKAELDATEKVYRMNRQYVEDSKAKIAELEKQLGEKDAELKDLVRLQAGEFYLVHHKSHPDPAEEFVKAFNSLREDWMKLKSDVEYYSSGKCMFVTGEINTDRGLKTLADLKYKGE